MTLPPRPEPQGSVHPVTQVWQEVIAIFGDMGFAVAEGPPHRDGLGTISAR